MQIYSDLFLHSTLHTQVSTHMNTAHTHIAGMHTHIHVADMEQPADYKVDTVVCKHTPSAHSIVMETLYVEASQVSWRHCMWRLPRCHGVTVCGGIPGVMGTLYAEASQVSWGHCMWRHPRCHGDTVCGGIPGVMGTLYVEASQVSWGHCMWRHPSECPAYSLSMHVR